MISDLNVNIVTVACSAGRSVETIRCQEQGGMFASTHWSIIGVAASNRTSERAQVALGELCKAYWSPLYVFIRRRGLAPEEAQDLTQEFLAEFLSGDKVARADRNIGRFRSFLVASLENFLHNQWRRRTAQKRGGGQASLTLDTVNPEVRFANALKHAETPADAYDRQWACALVDEALGALRSEWERDGRGALFEAFQAHLWEDATSVPYAELCAQFDLTPVNLRVTFHRFRQRYRDLLRQAVAATVATEAEVEDELRFLMQVVSR